MNNTSKKKIYCINIDGDYGELWLGHDKEPLAHVHSNDANFREEYQRFIFDYLGVELIYEAFYIKSDKTMNKLYDSSGDEKEIAKILKKQIAELP